MTALADLYRDLHRNPELSLAETRTAGIGAAWLREAGFETTEGVGGTGVVGVLRNGPGPTALLRADIAPGRAGTTRPRRPGRAVRPRRRVRSRPPHGVRPRPVLGRDRATRRQDRLGTAPAARRCAGRLKAPAPAPS